MIKLLSTIENIMVVNKIVYFHVGDYSHDKIIMIENFLLFYFVTII